jgi:hypothetical protein
MGSALNDPRGGSHCLVGGYGTPTFFSPRLQALVRQVQRDDNVRALLEAIRDAFEFAKEVDTLRNIKPESMQAKILGDMLLCVSKCGEFIESYAKDVQVGMSSRPPALINV